jgi:hypothetical protein
MGHTVNVAVFGINTNPIVATAGHYAGMVCAWQHLPCSETEAGACSEGVLEFVGGLHGDLCVFMGYVEPAIGRLMRGVYMTHRAVPRV